LETWFSTPSWSTIPSIRWNSFYWLSLCRARALDKKVADYRIPLKGMFLIEGFMCLWSVAAFLQYMALYKFIIGPILLLHATGFGYVCVTSIIHESRTRRLSAGG